MMNITKIIIACLFFSFYWGLANTWAVEKVLVVTEQFPPFNYQENNSIKGISTTILKRLMEEASLDYHLEIVPWKRAYETTLNRPNTLIYTIAKTASRRDKFHWVGKISNRKVSLFRLRERHDLEKMTFDEAKTKAKIATVQGDASTEMILNLEFNRENLTIIHDTTLSSLCIKHVINGRSDYFPMNPYSLKYRVDTGKVPDLFTDQFIIHDADGYYIAANIQTDPNILEALEQAYGRLEKMGFIESITSEYIKF